MKYVPLNILSIVEKNVAITTTTRRFNSLFIFTTERLEQ